MWRARGGRTGNTTVIDGNVGLHATAQGGAQLIAQQPATLAGERHFAVEATHGVAATDGEAVLRHQRRAIPLRAPAAGVAQALAAPLHRHHQLRIGGVDAAMRRTFADGRFRRTQSVESAGTLAVRQVHIQCGLADEVAVAQAQLPARHATALNFDLGIVDEVVRFAVPAARVHAGLGMRIAEQHAGQAKLGVAAGAALLALAPSSHAPSGTL
ncbi:hypothetical protein G6F50_014393 [Rhizopus delemar]|uniref:Uncharacterized protein n=1 Tax=Rhizopus delemar TaxID=936053 RepID=A0A9P6Y5Y1_9FUNG|nr:hypothetical protein G6F50_014393 [Rhizopus delemar]